MISLSNKSMFLIKLRTLQFKLMLNISNERPKRQKLTEYASMIKQLLQQIEKLTSQNDKIKKELLQANKIIQGSEREIQRLIMSIEQLQKVKLSFQSANMNKRAEKQRSQQILSEQLARRNDQILRLTNDIGSLKSEILSLKMDKDHLGNQLSTHKIQIMVLSQKYQSSASQKQILEKQSLKRQEMYKRQVQQLKKINATIKKNFQIIQNDYEQLLKENQQNNNIQTLRLNRRKRSSNPNPKPHQPNPIKLSSNPQMQEQLYRIKQQVSEQMQKINSTRQQAVKGRVDKTLATLESMLSQMSHRMYSSDQEEIY